MLNLILQTLIPIFFFRKSNIFIFLTINKRGPYYEISPRNIPSKNYHLHQMVRKTEERPTFRSVANAIRFFVEFSLSNFCQNITGNYDFVFFIQSDLTGRVYSLRRSIGGCQQPSWWNCLLALTPTSRLPDCWCWLLKKQQGKSFYCFSFIKQCFCLLLFLNL